MTLEGDAKATADEPRDRGLLRHWNEGRHMLLEIFRKGDDARQQGLVGRGIERQPQDRQQPAWQIKPNEAPL